MYLKFKYDYNPKVPVILEYVIEENKDLLILPSKVDKQVFAIWPTGPILVNTCYVDLDRIKEVPNEYLHIVKLAKQCLRDYNLRQILD